VLPDHLNWRGRPLTSHETILNLIGATTTSTGLKVTATLDTDNYPTGIKISDQEMQALPITRDPFHGEWNYATRRRRRRDRHPDDQVPCGGVTCAATSAPAPLKSRSSS
jgi:Rhodopirellula transposase DDE domain